MFSVERKILKLILNWIGKIIRMEDTRFPKALLRTLFEIAMDAANNLARFNWISQIKRVFFASIEKVSLMTRI